MRQAAATCLAEVAIPKAGFAGVKSEAEFMAVLEAGVAAQLIPKQLLPGFVDFYLNYKGASTVSACWGGKVHVQVAGQLSHWSVHSLDMPHVRGSTCFTKLACPLTEAPQRQGGLTKGGGCWLAVLACRSSSSGALLAC